MATIDVETAEKIFAIERLAWQFAGAKESRIRADLDVTTTRYYQMVNALIDTELALQLDPRTTRILRRRRNDRQLTRSMRSLA